MLVKELEQRIEEIKKAVDQSSANHHALLGRLNEAHHILSLLPPDENDIDEVATSE